MQKKVVIRPSLAAQAGKKAGAAAAQGTDNARRVARRVPVGGGGGGQKVQQNKDKERGWNTGTTLRNNFWSGDRSSSILKEACENFLGVFLGWLYKI